MNRISRNISIILKAEQTITRRRMAVLRNQTGLMAFAGVVAAIGLVLFNVAVFYTLRVEMSPQAAAITLSLLNFGLAGLLIIVATRMSAAKDVLPVEELRDMAIDDLESEVQGVVEEVRDLGANVRRIARDPLGNLLPSVLAPLIASLIRSQKK